MDGALLDAEDEIFDFNFANGFFGRITSGGSNGNGQVYLNMMYHLDITH